MKKNNNKIIFSSLILFVVIFMSTIIVNANPSTVDTTSNNNVILSLKEDLSLEETATKLAPNVFEITQGENKSYLINLKAKTYEDRVKTKYEIYKETLMLLRNLKNKDFTYLTFAFYLEENSSQILTLTFDKNDLEKQNLLVMDSDDLKSLATNIIIYNYFK